MLNDDATWAEVISVEVAEEALEAYNLTVTDYHTYFVAANENASPVWVHNTCGFTIDTVADAFTGMRADGGHAIRHLMDEGFIPNAGSLASRTGLFQNLTKGILTNPTATFNWNLRGLPVRGFMGTIDGKNVWVMVAKSGRYQGKVVTSFVPDATQLIQAGL